MAVTDRDSTQIGNIESTPSVRSQPYENGERRHRRGYVANAADDSATSVHRFMRVKSSEAVVDLRLTTADASTAGAVNCGVYDTEANGGAVVDADLFATAFALTSGPYENVSIMDLTQYSLTERMQPLWQALGLSADPHKEYDIAFTISTTYNGAGVGQILDGEFVG